jgi:hypothetical protein
MTKSVESSADHAAITQVDLEFYTVRVLGWDPNSKDPPPKLAIAWAHEKRIQELEEESRRSARLAQRGAFVSALAVALATLAATNAPWGMLWDLLKRFHP